MKTDIDKELEALDKVDLGDYYGIDYTTESVVEDLLRIIGMMNDEINKKELK